MSFAAKLRKMDGTQQIFAESLMHQVYTLGLLNKLNENYSVADNNKLQSQHANNFQNNYQSSVETQLTPSGQSSYTVLNYWGNQYPRFNLHNHLLTTQPYHLPHLHLRLLPIAIIMLIEF